MIIINNNYYLYSSTSPTLLLPMTVSVWEVVHITLNERVIVAGDADAPSLLVTTRRRR